MYNIDESRSALDMEQRLKIILPIEEKEAFSKQDSNREWAYRY
jgi:hypothetical protein